MRDIISILLFLFGLLLFFYGGYDSGIFSEKLSAIELDENKKLKHLVFTFGLSILLILFTEKVMTIFEFRQQKEASDNVKNEVANLTNELDDKFNCICIGKPGKALDYLSKSTFDALRIDNTHIVFNVPLADQGWYYTTEEWSRFEVASMNFVIRRKNTIFRNLVSSSRKDRDRKIFEETARRGLKDRYRLKTLNNTYPAVNFTILYYEDYSEVLFGWGHHNEQKSALVFLSRDEKIVAYFASYFEELWNMGEAITHSWSAADRSSVLRPRKSDTGD